MSSIPSLRNPSDPLPTRPVVERKLMPRQPPWVRMPPENWALLCQMRAKLKGR